MLTRWHLSAQRPGFKSLVAQLMCSLTGGPQNYTGRAMDEAHKHLNTPGCDREERRSSALGDRVGPLHVGIFADF